MKYKLKAFWFCLMAATLLIQSVGQKTYAEQGGEGTKKGYLVLILDASGSMWGQVKGGTKIGVGKKVLGDLVNNLPDGLNVGLLVYGQRRDGDCNDVEELVPISPIEKNKFIKKIQGIVPRGKTPITLSIQKTAEKLRSVEEESTVILVSDGKETCQGDPCALVQQLKESGVNFVIHVIGLDVTEDDRKQLECIAQAGGGTYYAAKDARGFMLAGQKIVKEPKFAVGNLTVAALKDGKPFTAYITIFRHGDENQIAQSYAYEPNPALFKLLPGIYDVKVVDDAIPQKPVVVMDAIEVKAGQTVKRRAKFTGEGFLMVEALKKYKPFPVYFNVYSSEGKGRIAGGYSYQPMPVKLLPGVYDVKIHSKSDKSIKEVKGITIRSGATKTIKAKF